MSLNCLSDYKFGLYTTFTNSASKGMCAIFQKISKTKITKTKKNLIKKNPLLESLNTIW